MELESSGNSSRMYKTGWGFLFCFVLFFPYSAQNSTMTTSTTKQRRTRTGCLCCRRRHKKCDEMKPSCQFCISKGLECEWPMKGSVFVNYQETKKPTPVDITSSSIISFSSSPSSPKTKENTSNSSISSIIMTSHGTPAQSANRESTKDPLQDKIKKDSNFYNYSFTPLPQKRISLDSPLPSMKEYHFIVPRDHNSGTSSQCPTNNTKDKNFDDGTLMSRLPQPKRLSVDSLLN